MARREEVYKPVLQKKNIPILTLDNKWHRLFTQREVNPAISALEQQLNNLLKRQGKLNTEKKDIKRLKKKLMDEIVSVRDEMEQSDKNTLAKKVEENKRLVTECSDKMAVYQDELLELPRKIQEVNEELMLLTMDICYDKMQANTKEILETAEWVNQIRVELKKRLIRKQEKEIRNYELYSYMHDLFGAEVMEIFDLKYNPEENRPRLPLDKKGKTSAGGSQPERDTK